MRIAAVVVFAVAALAVRARAEEPAREPAADKSAPQPRQMRTVHVEGGTIRYEVLPGDDSAPAGQLIVVPAERRRSAALADEGAGHPLPGDEVEGERGPSCPPGHRARREARDGCSELRGKLAARLLFLRGLDVSEDVALWLQRNPSYFPQGLRIVDVLRDDTLAEMVKVDLTARDYAEQLARCESR
jgi:hypothetical protein